jgi:hypothetical protein
MSVENVHFIFDAVMSKMTPLNVFGVFLFLVTFILASTAPDCRKPRYATYTPRGVFVLILGLFGGLVALLVNLSLLGVISYHYVQELDRGGRYYLQHAFARELQLFFMSSCATVFFMLLAWHSQRLYKVTL